MRGLTIAHSSFLAKMTRAEEKILTEEIKILEDMLPTNPDLIDNHKLAKSKLDSIYIKRAAGHKVRAREKYIDLDERPSKFFLEQEQKRAKVNNPNCIFRDDNTLTSDPKEILDLQENFYRKLYEKRILDLENANFFTDHLPQVSDEIKA